MEAKLSILTNKFYLEDFLLKNVEIITHGVEFLAALTGLYFYRKYRNSNAKYFIYFLIYLSICDFLGIYPLFIDDNFLSFLDNTIFVWNYWWYTLFWKIGAILFFAFYYSKILHSKFFIKIIRFSSYVFFAFSIIYILLNWDDYFIKSFPPISVFGAIIIFLCSVFYFIETLTSDKILTFFKSINFYISVAIFIWWLIITPLVFYDIYNSNKDWNFMFLKWEIYLFANIFMYLTYTFALIWCKPEND